MIEVVILNEYMEIVASGQIDDMEELDYQYCDVRLCNFGDYTRVDSDYVFPCGKPLGLVLD